MTNNLNKSNLRDPEVAIRVKRTADIVGVSTRTVYRVLAGHENVSYKTIEKVMIVYKRLESGENHLLNAVKELVPFE